MVAGTSAAVAVVLFIVLFLVNWVVAVVVAVMAGAATAWAVTTRADRAVLASIGAVEVGGEAEPRLHNLVEGLCVAAGLPKPALYLVDDPAPNACVFGRDHRRAFLVVTTGLLRTLERIELEGVIAHELSRIKNLEIAPETVAVTAIGLPLFLAERAARAPAHPPGPDPLSGAGTAATLLLKPLAPVSARLLHRAVTAAAPHADVEGVSLTRYPPGLVAALEKLQSRGTFVAAALAATNHLWLAPAVDPSGPGRFQRLAAVVGGQPQLEERIEALREL